MGTATTFSVRTLVLISPLSRPLSPSRLEHHEQHRNDHLRRPSAHLPGRTVRARNGGRKHPKRVRREIGQEHQIFRADGKPPEVSRQTPPEKAIQPRPDPKTEEAEIQSRDTRRWERGRVRCRNRLWFH